jgi:deoxyribonuclease IV
MAACDQAQEKVGKGAIELTSFRRLTKDSCFVNIIGILETSFPGRYGETLQRLESPREKK